MQESNKIRFGDIYLVPCLAIGARCSILGLSLLSLSGEGFSELFALISESEFSVVGKLPFVACVERIEETVIGSVTWSGTHITKIRRRCRCCLISYRTGIKRLRLFNESAANLFPHQIYFS